MAEAFVEKLPRKYKVAYGVASGASGLLSGLGLNQLIYFYTERLGFDTGLQGIAWLVFMAWNAINDPLFGIFQEKTKSKLGRRVPYLRYGAPIYVILFILVWFPFAPPGNQLLLFINYTVVLFFFDTIYSMIGLVTYSLPAEMAITSKERGSIITYSTMIGFLPQMLGIAIPLVVLRNTDVTIWQWQAMMIIIAIVCGVLLFASSYFIKENKWAQREDTYGFWESIKETVKNKQFLILEVSIFALLMVSTVITSGILFLFDYVLLVNDPIEYAWFALPVLTLLASIILFNKYMGKLGPKKIFLIGSVIGAAGFALLPFFPRHISVLTIPIMLVTVGFGAIIIGQQPLMADVIDYDETLTGKRRETTYSGVNALFTKAAISIANYFFLFILGVYGYKAELDVQVDPVRVGDGVVLAFTIIPLVSVAISSVALLFFKLDGKEWLEKKAALQEIHARKEIEYIEWLKKTGKLDDDPGPEQDETA